MPGQPKRFEKLSESSSGKNIPWALFALLTVALWPAGVWAQTLGNMVCHIKDNIKVFVPLFNALAFTVGMVLIFKGAIFLKKHSENANENPVIKGVAHLLVGGALAALPIIVGTIQDTLHLDDASGSGTVGCVPGPIAGGAVGLDEMMQNFVNNIYQPMFYTLSVLCFIVGIFLIFRGLLKASKSGTDPRAGAPHGIAASMLIGAVLVSISAMFSTMMETLFGTTIAKNFANLINWSVITGGGVDTTAADLTVQAILMFVQIVGLIAFIRGWLMIKHAVEGTGQVTVPQGLTHIIGGTMAMNIGAMIELFDRTFGTGLVL